jgi:hypothetical protein
MRRRWIDRMTCPFHLWVPEFTTANRDGWVTCHHYGDKTPILVIDAGGASVSFSVQGREASASAVEFARTLAGKAQEFAADIERMHAA